jgi:hypothetical protein
MRIAQRLQQPLEDGAPRGIVAGGGQAGPASAAIAGRSTRRSVTCWAKFA